MGGQLRVAHVLQLQWGEHRRARAEQRDEHLELAVWRPSLQRQPDDGRQRRTAQHPTLFAVW